MLPIKIEPLILLPRTSVSAPTASMAAPAAHCPTAASTAMAQRYACT
jgi:hypothetical protein